MSFVFRRRDGEVTKTENWRKDARCSIVEQIKKEEMVQECCKIQSGRST